MFEFYFNQASTLQKWLFLQPASQQVFPNEITDVHPTQIQLFYNGVEVDVRLMFENFEKAVRGMEEEKETLERENYRLREVLGGMLTEAGMEAVLTVWD